MTTLNGSQFAAALSAQKMCRTAGAFRVAREERRLRRMYPIAAVD